MKRSEVIFGRLKLGNEVWITSEDLEDWEPGAAANLELRTRIDRLRDGLFLQLRTWLLKAPHPAKMVTLNAPATWWDHFKVRWFPEWLNRRYPVRYGYETEYEYGPIYVCPHANIKWPANSDIHISWMLQEEK